MTSRELSEPELCPTDLIVWKIIYFSFYFVFCCCFSYLLNRPSSHSPVAVGKVAQTSSKKAHNDQNLGRMHEWRRDSVTEKRQNSHPHNGANGTGFLDGNGARRGEQRNWKNGLSRPKKKHMNEAQF